MRSFVSSFASVCFVLGVSACSHDVGDGAEDVVVSVVDSDSEGAVSYVVPANVDSDRVYFGVTNLSISTDAPLSYNHFDLLPRGKVDVTLARADDNRRNVGFKVYRVNPTGTLRLLGQVSGRRSAGVHLESDAGGTFVVEATGTIGNSGTGNLTLELRCTRRDGLCAPMVQPGGSCGGRRANASCDEGLFCQIDQQCGRADQTGTCTIPSTICPAVAPRTVCGCDGVDYADACHAHAAGANVDHDGACVVEECAYEKIPEDTSVNTHGIWTWTGANVDNDITATLGLHDGDFSYTQVWDPKCLHTAPFCRRASLVFSMTGGWENRGTSVQLLPDAESTPAPDVLAQSFSISMNCDGDVRLTTTETGEERVFTRDLCADFSCNTEEGWVCEVQPVTCIRAPCPPQPTCVLH